MKLRKFPFTIFAAKNYPLIPFFLPFPSLNTILSFQGTYDELCTNQSVRDNHPSLDPRGFRSFQSYCS